MSHYWTFHLKDYGHRRIHLPVKDKFLHSQKEIQVNQINCIQSTPQFQPFPFKGYWCL